MQATKAYPDQLDQPLGDLRPSGLLHAAVQRSLRMARTPAIVVLHLSALLPPAPRPHHRRIARAILDDAASRFDGQVFLQASGDLVLLCRPDGVASTAETLARLFRIDTPCAEALLTLWELPGDAAAVFAYAGRVLQTSERPEPDDVRASLANAPMGQLLQQQTAIRLDGVMRPAFQEIMTPASPVTSLAAMTGHDGADPALVRYGTAQLDRRLLENIGASAQPDVPIHLNLALASILSDAFPSFADASRRDGMAIAVEVSFPDACADTAGFAAARDRLRHHGIPVVLDGLSHLALLLTRPEAADPDLVKLDWSARIPGLPARNLSALERALDRIGRDRIVLDAADTEAALAWGLVQGIHCFQGRHADAMLAAAHPFPGF
jgi:hypothetical protein